MYKKSEVIMKNLIEYCNPKVVFFFFLIVGIFMLFVSLRMPNHTETEEYEMLNYKYSRGEISKDEYLTEFGILKGNRIKIMDIGSGLMVSSIFILCFLYVKRINGWCDLLKLKSMKKITVISLSNIILLMQIPGCFLYYSYRLSRGDYPCYADNIGIPIMSQTIVNLIGIIPLNIFLILALINSDLNTPLFVKNNGYKKTVVWNVLFVIFVIFQSITFVASVIDGDCVFIISSLLFVYILLSLRAGKINYANINS